MIERYGQKFAELKAGGGKAFIPFTLLGWRTADESFEIVKTLIDAGASALELGFAFSDPVADGPIIQAAAFETIEAGFRLDDAFELLQRIRTYDAKIPIGLLLYYNVVLSRGVERFYKQAADAGVDSILIADLPADCAPEVAGVAQAYGIAPVFIISPLTDDERLAQIAKVALGYLYVVSRLGITGTHETYDNDLQSLLSRARKVTQLPLCVGFGISTPEQAKRMISMGADGVITGSGVIQIVRQQGSGQTLLTYAQSMVNAVNLTATHR